MAEEELEEGAQDGAEQEEQQEQKQGGGDAPDPEIEQRAREMGWVPPDEFRGGPENALSAEEFVRRGEEILPIVNKRNRELEKKLQSVQGDVKELVRHMGEQRRSSHEQQIQELKQQRDKAVDEGDMETYKRLDQEIEQRRQKAPEPPKQDDTPQGWTPEFKATFESWQANNEWYGKDPVLSREFEDFHDWFLNRNPNMDDDERLKEAEKAVREKYPQKFGGGRRKSGGSPVEGGASTPRKGSGKKKGYDDLPPEAKQAYDKFVTNQKVMSGDEYLKEYFGEE